MRCLRAASRWRALRHGQSGLLSRLAHARRTGVVARCLVICCRRRGRNARKHAIGLVPFARLARTFTSLFQPDYPYSLDPAWIGVEDFELEKIGSRHDFSTHGQAPRAGHQVAADCVDVLYSVANVEIVADT